MQVETVVTGALAEHCYVLGIEGRPDCVVIDPGSNPERILRAVNGRQVAAILLTHCHFDHIGAVPDVKGEGTRVVIHRLDAPGLTDPWLNASQWMGFPLAVPEADCLVGEGDCLSFAGLDFQVLHTPGHTAGSVCYQCGECLFTGDTVMGGGVGRTDLPSGSEEAMQASLRRLMPLLKQYHCYGGH